MLPTHYSLIFYAPDLASEEKIIIGVVVFDENQLQVKFTSDWERIKAFDFGEDISYLKSFSKIIQFFVKNHKAFPGYSIKHSNPFNSLKDFSETFSFFIKYGEPKKSVKSLEKLLSEVEIRYLSPTKQRFCQETIIQPF